MFKRIIISGILALPVAAWAQPAGAQASEAKLPPTWSVSLTGGFTNTFQMVLGGTFGDGPGFQNKLAASVSSLLRQGAEHHRFLPDGCAHTAESEDAESEGAGYAVGRGPGEVAACRTRRGRHPVG